MSIIIVEEFHATARQRPNFRARLASSLEALYVCAVAVTSSRALVLDKVAKPDNRHAHALQHLLHTVRPGLLERETRDNGKDINPIRRQAEL
jgi:hypothetical protein